MDTGHVCLVCQSQLRPSQLVVDHTGHTCTWDYDHPPAMHLACYQKGRGIHVVELFSGSGTLSKAAQRRGCTTTSLDVKQWGSVDLVMSALDFRLDLLPCRPSFIWASPPCTSYSIAAISRHRRDGKPISEQAVLGDLLVKKTLSLIAEAGCPYVIENPVGLLRTMDFMQGLDRRTVSFCQYGDKRMKPTDLWSNMFADMFQVDGWEPRPPCTAGSTRCHHDRQPRNYAIRKSLGLEKGGTQGMLNAHERAKLPATLCDEVLDAVFRIYAQQA